MPGCPDQECHKGKERLERCVDEIKKELPNKVSRKALGGFFLSVIGVLAMFIVYALSASATSKDERKENAKQIEVVKKTIEIEFKHVKEKLDKQITTGDIYRTVKRVMKENGDD